MHQSVSIDEGSHSAGEYGARKRLIESDDWQGPGFSMCMQAATVCRAFKQPSFRMKVLSFALHRQVADLMMDDRTEEEQPRWRNWRG